MTERYLRIEGPESNGVYGRLRSQNHRNLIIHIHGLTHSMNHMLEVFAADYFPQHGYDHYRIGLYAREQDSRNLIQSSLSTHVQDIRAVLKYFRNYYDNIFISAHSLGALCVLILNPENIRAVSLWDPATDVSHFWSVGNFLTHVPERKQYLLDYGNVFVLGEDMVSQMQEYPDAVCVQMAEDFYAPAQMIIPQETIFLASPHASPDAYLRAFQAKSEIHRMIDANHTFSHQGNPQALLEKTRSWFDRFR